MSVTLPRGTKLFTDTMRADFAGDTERAALLQSAWSPTPWMVDANTRDREREMRAWCLRMFGPESDPIRNKPGDWRQANVTIHGMSWFGFATEEQLRLFTEQFNVQD